MSVAENLQGVSLTLSAEEQTELLAWLEQRLKDKRVEEHRTDRSDFRKHVQHEEQLIEGLIAKLRR